MRRRRTIARALADVEPGATRALDTTLSILAADADEGGVWTRDELVALARAAARRVQHASRPQARVGAAMILRRLADVAARLGEGDVVASCHAVITDAMADPDAAVRAAARAALRSSSLDADRLATVRALLDAAVHEDADQRRDAVFRLAGSRDVPTPVLDRVLRSALDDHEPRVRDAAAEAAGLVAVCSDALLEALVAYSRNARRSGSVAGDAIVALVSRGVVAAERVFALLASRPVTDATLAFAVRIGAPPEALLRRGVREGDANVGRALVALVSLGSAPLARGLRDLAGLVDAQVWYAWLAERPWSDASCRTHDVWSTALKQVAFDGPCPLRLAAIDALCARSIAEPTSTTLALAVLLEALTHDAEPEVSEAAVRARAALLVRLARRD